MNRNDRRQLALKTDINVLKVCLQALELKLELEKLKRARRTCKYKVIWVELKNGDEYDDSGK